MLAVALNRSGTKGNHKLGTKIEMGCQGTTFEMPYLQRCIPASALLVDISVGLLFPCAILRGSVGEVFRSPYFVRLRQDPFFSLTSVSSLTYHLICKSFSRSHRN